MRWERMWHGKYTEERYLYNVHGGYLSGISSKRTYKQTNRLVGEQTDGRTGRQTNRQAEGQKQVQSGEGAISPCAIDSQWIIYEQILNPGIRIRIDGLI